MKIRIKDNSLRLRLTQKEIHELEETGKLHAHTPFGQGQAFGYSLHLDAAIQQPEGRFEAGEIRVLLPEDMATTWIQSNQVGIEAVQEVAEGSQLHLLIEKDFKCLHPGERREDESDHFPHPMEEA